jgi:hypothetical protein
MLSDGRPGGCITDKRRERGEAKVLKQIDPLAGLVLPAPQLLERSTFGSRRDGQGAPLRRIDDVVAHAHHLSALSASTGPGDLWRASEVVRLFCVIRGLITIGVKGAIHHVTRPDPPSGRDSGPSPRGAVCRCVRQ